MRVLNGSLAEPCGVTLINSLSSFCSRDREESSRNIHHLSPFSLLFSPLEFVSAFKEPLDCRSAVPQLLAKSPNIRVLTRGAPHPKKILQASSKHPPSILQASSKHPPSIGVEKLGGSGRTMAAAPPTPLRQFKAQVLQVVANAIEADGV